MVETYALPDHLVKESSFQVELEFEVPEDFWDLKEPVYEDPAQKLFWEEARIVRENWLDNFHWALRRSGWPAENIDAIYSYFEEPVQNPDEGEERAWPPIMRFYINIPGTWLVDHRDFFRQFDHLRKDGLKVLTKDQGRVFHLNYWRITAEGGELGGETWEGTYFVVHPRREGLVRHGPLEWFPER